MSRFQVFTLDLLLSLLAFLAATAVLVYLQYNYSFKLFHLEKVNVMVSRYYPVANAIMSICLAKIDSGTGKLIPYYFKFNESIMFAADNFSSIDDGLKYICENIFGYNSSNRTQQRLFRTCEQMYQPYVVFCRNLDENFDWFVMDNYGAVYFISKHLRQNIPGNSRLEKRMFLSYAMNYYVYGKTFPTDNYPGYKTFVDRQPLFAIVPAAGVSEDYLPLFFIQLADGLYYRIDNRSADNIINPTLMELWILRRNFTPENLPVGVIGNEYQFEQYLLDPEPSIAINLHSDVFPAVYELVKNETTWLCVNDTEWLGEHYLANYTRKLLSNVFWINVWGYPAYYLATPYCKNWSDKKLGRGFIKIGRDSLQYLGIGTGFNSFKGSYSFDVNPSIRAFLNKTFGILLPKTIMGSSSLGSCSDAFYLGTGCLGLEQMGSGGLAVLGGQISLLIPMIAYIEYKYGFQTVRPTSFYVVFLSKINYTTENNITRTINELGS
jgi:hypothetical protein